MLRHLSKMLLPAAVAIALLSPLAASAQAKCKFVAQETDPFTKVTRYSAVLPVGPTFVEWNLMLREEGGKYYFGLFIPNGKDGFTPLPAGSKVSLLFADDTSLDIVNSKDREPIPLIIMGDRYYQWPIIEEVSKADFTRFSKSLITALRLATKGKDYPYLLPGIKEKQTERIKTTAACMLGN